MANAAITLRRVARSIAFLSAASATTAVAAPVVATDIAPIHSLVSRVMHGVGEPALVMPPGASPHTHAMRPSEAAAIERADVVFWVSETLTPWFGSAVETLAPSAVSVELMDAPGVTLLPFRVGGTFEEHSHAHDDHGHGHEDHGHSHDDHGHAHDDHGHAHDDHGHAHDDHGHDHDDHGHDHDDHGHAHDDHAHDDHAHGHDDHAHGHDDHAHGAMDDHLWLDPENAKVWLGVIAATLSEADPDNASVYFTNASAAREELAALSDEIAALLAPIAGRGFIVFHDAYQYFENRFGVSAAGSITLGDASQPSAARVAEIRARVQGLDAACVFAEPQFEPRLVSTVIEGTDARAGVLDPIGAELTPGPDLYPTLLRNLATSLVECLG
ncbi:MAG: zinc transporter [Rhodobacteraceae bacterium]|nr:MAG: zinc transporter [Paracoccaceae bacterium]